MPTVSGRRLGALAGIAFVIVVLVAFFIPGTPPKADEAPREITEYFADKQREIQISTYLLGLAFAFFLVFLAGLRNYVAGWGERDEPGDRDRTLASATVLGGSIGAVLILAGAALINAGVYRTTGVGSNEGNRLLYDIGNQVFTMSGFGFAVFFAAAGLAGAAARTLPAWMAPAGLLIGLGHLVGGFALLANDGFFAVGGEFGFIVTLASILWVLVAAICMHRTPDAGSDAAPVGAATPA
jgi:hypothetical protein